MQIDYKICLAILNEVSDTFLPEDENDVRIIEDLIVMPYKCNDYQARVNKLTAPQNISRIRLLFICGWRSEN